jgi:sec-independent protein translocase protein TatB
MQRYVNDVKADISREMELEELKKMQSSMEDAARSMRDSVSRGISETEGEFDKIAQSAQVESAPRPDAAPPPAAAAPASRQGELPLEPGPQAPERKHA